MSTEPLRTGLVVDDGLLAVPADEGVEIATATDGEEAAAAARRAASSVRPMYAMTRTPPGLNSLARAERNDSSSPCARVAGATR